MSRGAQHVAYDPAKHHRQSIRLRGHDYAGTGAYFVTVCVRTNGGAKNLSPLRFGTVVNGRMALNEAGRIAADCWRAIPDHFPHATLDEWVVMPDHVHGIIVLRGDGPGERRGERFFAPAGWPTRPQCVVSGFLSPMKRAVFDACLADGIPMVQVLARGLSNPLSARVERAIDAGRLLVMTPFDADVTRFSAARAAWCNQYALHLADNIVIGQMSPDGMLACLLTDAPQGKPVLYLNQQQGVATSVAAGA